MSRQSVLDRVQMVTLIMYLTPLVGDKDLKYACIALNRPDVFAVFIDFFKRITSKFTVKVTSKSVSIDSSFSCSPHQLNNYVCLLK